MIKIVVTMCLTNFGSSFKGVIAVLRYFREKKNPYCFRSRNSPPPYNLYVSEHKRRELNKYLKQKTTHCKRNESSLYRSMSDNNRMGS